MILLQAAIGATAVAVVEAAAVINVVLVAIEFYYKLSVTIAAPMADMMASVVRAAAAASVRASLIAVVISFMKAAGLLMRCIIRWLEIKNRAFLLNRTEHIRHQCRKATVLSCHRCLINSGVEKINYI